MSCHNSDMKQSEKHVRSNFFIQFKINDSYLPFFHCLVVQHSLLSYEFKFLTRGRNTFDIKQIVSSRAILFYLNCEVIQSGIIWLINNNHKM